MFELVVTYDNGDTETVAAGQREMAAYEMAGHGSSVTAPDERPMLFFRVLAFYALKRGKRLPAGAGKYELWTELVDEVMPTDEKPTADPTTPDQLPAG